MAAADGREGNPRRAEAQTSTYIGGTSTFVPHGGSSLSLGQTDGKGVRGCRRRLKEEGATWELDLARGEEELGHAMRE